MNIRIRFLCISLFVILLAPFSAFGLEKDFDLVDQKILTEKELRRYGHTVTPIGPGSNKLFIFGGYKFVSRQSYNWADARSDGYVFDLNSGKRVSTSSVYGIERVNHESVTLKNGKIALVGGWRPSRYSLPILIFDPVTNQIEKKSRSRECVRYLASATVLNDGKILIAGGLEEYELSKFKASNKSCLYNPEDDTFEILPAMKRTKYRHQATLLNDGRVLFSGGFNKEELYLNELEVFEPQSKEFKFVDNLKLGRIGHAATKLADGTVLITGGKMDDHVFHSHVEVFDPSTNSVTEIKSRLINARSSHGALLLSTGEVLVVGGYALREQMPDLIEIFDPKTNLFSAASHLSFPRIKPLVVELSPSKILVSGGDGFKHYARKQELITLK